jgi:hypothetical protein
MANLQLLARNWRSSIRELNILARLALFGPQARAGAERVKTFGPREISHVRYSHLLHAVLLQPEVARTQVGLFSFDNCSGIVQLLATAHLVMDL